MSAMRQILVVEDEESVRQRMVSILQFEGYSVAATGEMAEAIRMLGDQVPDVILCDIMMPRGDGVDLVSMVRSRADLRLVPIIMVTALTERRWQRRFMELGADDFLTKPFRAAELVGAVEMQCAKLAWREESMAEHAPGRPRLFAGWTFDPVRRSMSSEDTAEITLTPKEAELLTVLLDHAGQSLSREMIAENLGRSHDPLDRGIDILIGRLRKLLGDNSRNPTLIRTIRGQGYMLDTDVVPG